MSRVVKAALLQCSYTGEKQSMIDKHVKYVVEAADQGVQIMCFQELFYAPYFCQVQDSQFYSLSETIPNGPIIELMQEVAANNNIVLVLPMYEEDNPGVYYNTGVVIDSDGTYIGKYRKTHLPHLEGFWEKFYFRPGNTGYPVFQTSVGKIGVYICYDRHFPEGARALGINGAEIVFMPSATSSILSQHLWQIEQRSHAIANGYFVGTINRVGVEQEFGQNNYYGQSYFCDPAGQFIGSIASDNSDELVVRDLQMDLIRGVRNTWQFYRDRRPDRYSDLVVS